MNEEPPPPLLLPLSLSLACSLVFHGKFALACHCVPSSPSSSNRRPATQRLPIKTDPRAAHTRPSTHRRRPQNGHRDETVGPIRPSPPDIQQGLNNKSEGRHAYYVSLLVGSTTTDHGPQLTLCVDRRPTFLEIRY